MISYNKYNILSLNFSDELDFNLKYLKFDYMQDFVYKQIKDKSYFLFEMKPGRDSILYDITEECFNISINSQKVLYTKNLKLNSKTILQIIKDDSFYLGHILIVVHPLNEEIIANISSMWEGGIYETGIEFFRMGNDGKSFYWYNPQSKNAENSFKELFNDYARQTIPQNDID